MNIKTINIYDNEGNLLTDEDIVKTGLIIKLEYNEKVYDEAIMVVRGDVDGDGVVNVTDDEYLTLLARYQSFFCPKKIDRITIWTSSEVTKDAYIFSYELKGKEAITREEQKKRIFAQINTNGVHAKRLVNSNRKLVFRYTYRQTGETIEIVFTPDELR